MIPLTLAELARAVGGFVADAPDELTVTAEAFVDSRRPISGGLYVAILGERVDGHDYAVAAVEAGAAAVLAQRPVGVPAVVVGNCVEALGRLAHHVVGALKELTVVAITGSQGKTSTKDLLAQLLETHGETVSAVGSLNNEIGAPLTALRATSSTRYLIVEMGARGPGHIAYLASMVLPTIGAVLNVGVAHVGEFGSQAAIARAKGELVEALPSDGYAVLNADDPLIVPMRERTSAAVLTFGTGAQAQVRLTDITLDDSGCPRFTVSFDNESRDVAVLPLVGEHQAYNAVAAAAIALACGMTLGQITSTLGTASARSRWRMEVSTTAQGVTVINDAYNANPDSMRAALKTLAELGHRRHGRTFAVLGEMLELGADSREAHDEIGRLVVRLDISQLVVVGDAARPMHLGAALEGSWNGESICVEDREAAIELLGSRLRAGDVVLVKASRRAGLEMVAAALLETAPADSGPADTATADTATADTAPADTAPADAPGEQR